MTEKLFRKLLTDDEQKQIYKLGSWDVTFYRVAISNFMRTEDGKEEKEKKKIILFYRFSFFINSLINQQPQKLQFETRIKIHLMGSRPPRSAISV